jgi:hypothetical protein
VEERWTAVVNGQVAERAAQDWNEDRGWCGIDEHFGAAVTADDVAAFTDALRPLI